MKYHSSDILTFNGLLVSKLKEFQIKISKFLDNVPVSAKPGTKIDASGLEYVKVEFWFPVDSKYTQQCQMYQFASCLITEGILSLINL